MEKKFSPKMGGKKCQNPFQAILRQKKEKKKSGPLWGGAKP